MGKNAQHCTSQEVLALRARLAESESQRTLAEEEVTTLRRQLRSIQLVHDTRISLANTPTEQYGQLEEYEALCVALREQLAEGLNDAACGSSVHSCIPAPQAEESIPMGPTECQESSM